MPEPTPYWTKNPNLADLKENLSWNFPEQKKGVVKILGGNSSAFSTEVRVAEYINKTYPFISEVKNIFPDALKNKFPSLPNLEFYPSTDSGSFDKSPEYSHCLEGADFAIALGDLTKNSVTCIAVSEALKESPGTPTIITRDALDLIASESAGFMERDNIYILASMASLQKLFRALYYPRPIMLSQPIMPIVETLHKFTLTYPASIMTFHAGKIIVANGGNISTVDIEKTSLTPISIWSGNLAARIAIFAAFNPKQPLESMLAAILEK